MRLLVVTDGYYPSRLACAVRMRVIVETLVKGGHDVQVLASEASLDNCPVFYERPDYVTFFPVTPIGKKSIAERLKNNWSAKRSSVKSARRLGEFDAVICTSPPLLLASSAARIARQKKAMFILDIRDIWPDVAYEMGSFASDSMYAKIFEHIANRACTQAELVTTVTPSKEQKLKAKMGTAQCDKVMLVPNGIDLEFLEQQEDPELIYRHNLAAGPTCVYIGNIGLAQGLETLLAIASKNLGIRFLLFGDGVERGRLEAVAREEGLANVEFCGTIDERGVFTVLSRASLSYVPLVNSKLQDSVPTKIFEALGRGCPVLLAAQGDSATIVEESGLGAVVAPEDVEGIETAFSKMIETEWTQEQRQTAIDYVVANHSRQAAAQAFERKLCEMDGGR